MNNCIIDNKAQSMKHSVYRDNIFIILGAIIYAAIFCHLCINNITPAYSYVNFVFIYDIRNYCLFLLSSALMSLLICIQKNYTCRFFIASLYIMSIVPFLCLYFCGLNYNAYTSFFIKGIIAYIIIAIVTVILKKYPVIICRHRVFVNLRVDTIIRILSAITVFTIIRYIVLNGLDIFNLNILKVYEIRPLLKETMGGLLGYVDNWSIKIFNPLCILLSMHQKRYKSTVFFIALQIILFGFSSHKIALFIVAILLCFYLLAPKLLFKTRYLLFCATLGTLITKYSDSTIALSLWRRALLVPAQLNFYFGDFFSRHEFDWFAKSFMRHFITSKYDLPLPRIIGKEFYHSAVIHSNTGFLGAGYAQGGMVVIIIYAIIIAITINIIDSYTKVISPKIVIGITLLPMLTAFISSDLPTTFLTGGIIVTFLLLSVLSRCKDRAKLM